MIKSLTYIFLAGKKNTVNINTKILKNLMDKDKLLFSITIEYSSKSVKQTILKPNKIFINFCLFQKLIMINGTEKTKTKIRLILIIFDN